MIRRWISRTLVAAALLVAPRGSESAAVPEIPIDLRVFVHAAIEPAMLDLARRSATELLGFAGLQVEWDQCRVRYAECRAQDAARAITVRVVQRSLTDSHVCGGTRGDAVDGDVILVFLACHDELARTLGRTAAATLQVGDLLGLTVAHEVGHVLGLAHGAVGVMQARFDMNAFLDLCTSRLAFMPHEQLQMRQAMLVRARDTMAWARRPLERPTIWQRRNSK